jgi:enoyl-CoA hydratase/carnithine racemase
MTTLRNVDSDILLRTHQDGVLHLVLNRPAKRNALSEALREQIADSLTTATADDAVGAVVISGAGGQFCAGFDLKELAESPDPAEVFGRANRYHHCVHTFEKPLVAAMSGSAVAGGLDLALMCDIRVAGADATLGQPQVRQGIPAVFELLAEVVGGSAAREMCLTGRTVDANEALRMGLVHQVVEPGDVVDTALRLAVDIASLPAAADTKRQFLTGQPDLFSP